MECLGEGVEYLGLVYSGFFEFNGKSELFFRSLEYVLIVPRPPSAVF